MKLKSISRAVLASGMSLAIAFGATACSRDYVAAYVYVTNAGNTAGGNGSVSAFEVDFQTGVLTQIAGSPFTAGIGRNPLAVAAAPNGKSIYVVNRDDSNITYMAVGTDGKLYGQKTYTTVGTFPRAATIDSNGTFLYVTFTYQPGFTPVTGGPGGVVVFPINSDGTLNDSGKFTVNVGINPVAVAVSNPLCVAAKANALLPGNTACNNGAGAVNVFVYVLDQDPANPSIIGFYQNTSTGALASLSGSTNTTGYRAGITPSAIAVDPTTSYVYVTDRSANQIIGYQIQNSSTTPTLNGRLTALPTSPFTTGLYPVSMAIDPRGKYLLTANYNGNSVSSFTINLADGSLGGNAGASGTNVATGPTCVTIDPALGQYVYTSDQVNNSVSGLQLNANTGALNLIANSPFQASSLPSCATSVANGSHARSVPNP